MKINLRFPFQRNIFIRTILLLLAITATAAQADLIIEAGETFQLSGSESLTVNGNLTLNAASESESAAQLNGATSAEILVSGDWINNTSPASGSTDPTGFVHNNTIVYLTGTGNEHSRIEGETTFYQLIANRNLSGVSDHKKFVGDGIKFESGKTQTISTNGTLQLAGADADNLLSLQSTSNDNAATLDVSATDVTVTASHLNIKDSILSGYSGAPGETNSTNSGGNSGWFTPLSLSDTENSGVAENVAYSASAPTLTGTPVGSVTYSLTGADAAD
ncbi:MAG: hypothetical protein ACPG3V_07220, partial [Porticoccaceae bacterium]